MRANLEDNISFRNRQWSAKWGLIRQTITANINLDGEDIGPNVYFFLPSGGTRTVVLPTFTDGKYFIIGNVGTVQLLVVQNSLGVTLITLRPGDLMLFVSSRFEWMLLQLPSINNLDTFERVITVGDVNVTPTDRLIILNKTVAAATNINLPAVSSRLGTPLSIVDLGGNAGDIGIVPNGTDKVMGLTGAILVSNGQGLGTAATLTLQPITSLGTWVQV